MVLIRLSKHGGPTAADRHTFNLGGEGGVKKRLSSYKMFLLMYIFKLPHGHLIRLGFSGVLNYVHTKNASLVAEA